MNKALMVGAASCIASDRSRRGLLISTALATGVIAGMLTFAPTPAKAQTWDGSTDTLWGTGTNWVGDAVPAAGGVVVINNGALPNQPTLNIASAALTATNISAGTLTVANTLTSTTVTVSGTGNLTIQAGNSIVGAVSSGGAATVNNGTITGTLTVSSGTFTNAGAVTGATTLTGGTLTLQAGSNLADGQPLTVNGGVLNLNGVSDTVGSLSGTGGDIQTGGSGGGLVVNQTVNGTYAGGFSGATALNVVYLTKQGAADLTLSGANTTTGGGRIFANGGTLILQGGNAVGDENVLEVATGTVRLGASETIGVLLGSAAGTIDLNGNTLTIGGSSASANHGVVISGAGNLVVNTPGLTQRFDTAQTFTGTATISGGTLQYGAANILADTTNVVVNGGTLDIQGFNDTVAGVSLQSGSIIGTGTLTSTSNFDVRSGTVSASLGGAVGLDKTTAGTVILTGNNTYTGTTTISGGTLQIGDGGTAGSLGGGAVTIDAGATLAFNRSDTVVVNNVLSGGGGLVQNGSGILQLNAVNTYTGTTTVNNGNLFLAGSIPANNDVVINAPGFVTLFANSTFGSLAGNGGMVLNNLSLTTGGNGASTTFSGVITGGVGSLTKDGIGTFTLTGANTYSGSTTVNAGTLSIGAGGTTGSLAGGPIVVNAPGTLALNRSDALTLANVISGNGTIDKLGAGATTLSGNSQVFAGTTNVNAGTLLVTGNLGGTVNVNAGGTLGGTGSVGGLGAAVTINNGGTLAAGLSPGTLLIGGDLNLLAGSNSTFELNTTQQVNGVGPTGNDLVDVGGNLTITNGAILNVGPAVSGYYRLFNVGGVITPGGGANFGFTTINTAPGTTTASVYASSAAPNQVNLFLSNGGQLVQAWDGTDFTGAGAGGQGGNGTWNGTNTNWTENPAGVINDSWRSQVGFFGGAAGTVTVVGAQSFQGLQFATTGYTLTGGTINAIGNNVGGGNAAASFLNVDGGVTATIASVISGGAIGIDKLGAGTLVLTGANTFTGLTSVLAGTLVNNGTLPGAVSNAATFTNNGTVGGGLTNTAGTATNTGIINGGATNAAGATLATSNQINGGLTNAGAVTASGQINGAIVNQGAGAFTVNGALTGNSTFANNGASQLFVTGGNFTGLTALTNSSSAIPGVSVSAGRTLGAQTIQNNAGSTFNSAGTVIATTSVTNAGTAAFGGALNTPLFGNSGTFSVNAGGLGGATTVFTNTGTANISAGDFTGVGTFNNAGTLLANGGGARTLGAATFNNGGTGSINQQNGAVTDVLNLTGTYAGAAGSRIVQDVNLASAAGGAANGDRVVIAGAATGRSDFAFNIVNPGRAVFATPIPVLTAGSTAGMTANEGLISRSGFFDYFLRRNAANTGFEIASQFNSGPAAGVAGGISGVLSSLQAGFHQPASAIVSTPDECKPNQLMAGPFIRVNAGETTVKNGSVGDVVGGGAPFTNDSKSTSNFKGFQTGFDVGLCNINNSGWNIHLGIMGGLVDVTSKGNSRSPTPIGGIDAITRTQADASVPFIGAYTFVGNGAFTAEFNVRRDFYDMKVSASDSTTTYVGPGQKLKGDGISFNGQMQYRFTFAERFYIEPYVGLSKSRSSFDLLPFATGGADFMRFSTADSLLGRAGVNLGAAFFLTEKFVVAPFLTASVWREFAKPLKAQAIIGSSGQTFLIETDRVGTFGQVGAGLQFKLIDTPLVGFVRGDVRFGDKIEGKAINAGLRLQF